MAAARAGSGPVVAGLGITEMGKIYDRTTAGFAAEAVRLAAADAGLSLADIDGLLVSTGVTGGVGLELQRDLGLRNLTLLSEMQAFGATAGAMLQLAATSVQQGSSDAVACVFADAPLRPKVSSASAYGGRGMGQNRMGRVSPPPVGSRGRIRCTRWPPGDTWSATGRRANSSPRSQSPSGLGRPTTRGPRCAIR